MSWVKSVERMKNRPPGAVSRSVSSARKPALVMSMLRPLMLPSRLKMPPATRRDVAGRDALGAEKAGRA